MRVSVRACLVLFVVVALTAMPAIAFGAPPVYSATALGSIAAMAVDGALAVGFDSVDGGAALPIAWNLSGSTPTRISLPLDPTYTGVDAPDSLKVSGSLISATVDGLRRDATAWRVTDGVATSIDLRTPLAAIRPGTIWSSARDVDGSTVVGAANVGTEYEELTHAIAWTISGSVTAKDLGTLGGRSGYPCAVSGTWVVGESEIARDPEDPNTNAPIHAFAYDLASSTAMIDLDPTSSYYDSQASDVSGHLAVGYIKQPLDVPVMWDLSDPTPTAVPLPLGSFESGRAVAIDGTTAIGWADHGDTVMHAVAWKNLDTSPTLVEIAPTYDMSQASGISDNVVIGAAVDFTAGTQTAFAYDLDSPGIAVLPSNGHVDPMAWAISGDRIVGFSQADMAAILWTNDTAPVPPVPPTSTPASSPWSLMLGALAALAVVGIGVRFRSNGSIA